MNEFINNRKGRIKQMASLLKGNMRLRRAGVVDQRSAQAKRNAAGKAGTAEKGKMERRFQQLGAKLDRLADRLKAADLPSRDGGLTVVTKVQTGPGAEQQ
jgi:hypothetical protein